MYSAFGIDHGEGDIEKAFNPGQALRTGLSAFRGATRGLASGIKNRATGGSAGARAGAPTSGSSIYDQMRASYAGKPGFAGGAHKPAAPGAHKGSFQLKSFAGTGGGARKKF